MKLLGSLVGEPAQTGLGGWAGGWGFGPAWSGPRWHKKEKCVKCGLGFGLWISWGGAYSGW